MNIRKNLLCVGAALAAALTLMPAALAAEPGESAQAAPEVRAVLAEAPFPEESPPLAEDWRLLLVNPWNTLPEDYNVELATLSNGLQVDARIYDALEEMLSGCRAAGLSPVVCSAYRTEAKQRQLYENKVARVRASGVPEEQVEAEAARWVAPPGTSEHQTGLAVDIVAASYQILDEAQADTAEQRWLMEHCWEYGFVLRYPSEKSNITGIGYEPWHYRYVGREAAAAIYRAGVCLEEYLGKVVLPAAELTPARLVRMPEASGAAFPASGAGERAACQRPRYPGEPASLCVRADRCPACGPERPICGQRAFGWER